MVKLGNGLLFLVMVGLCSCTTATSAGYQELCESFRGTSEQALVSYWGKPDIVKKGPNGKIFRYSSITKTTIPGLTVYESQQTNYSGTINGIGIGDATYSGTSRTMVPMRGQDTVETTFCFTSFFIDNTGRVADYRYEGADCVAEDVSL